jgi:hypothetical protein
MGFPVALSTLAEGIRRGPSRCVAIGLRAGRVERVGLGFEAERERGIVIGGASNGGCEA